MSARYTSVVSRDLPWFGMKNECVNYSVRPNIIQRCILTVRTRIKSWRVRKCRNFILIKFSLRPRMQILNNVEVAFNSCVIYRNYVINIVRISGAWHFVEVIPIYRAWWSNVWFFWRFRYESEDVYGVHQKKHTTASYFIYHRYSGISRNYQPEVLSFGRMRVEGLFRRRYRRLERLLLCLTYRRGSQKVT